MLVASLNWVVALVGSYSSEGAQLATALDDTLIVICTAAFLGVHIMPAVFGILAGVQILRGFLEGDLFRGKVRAMRWAWVCLVVNVLLMGLCIAFANADGNALLRILSYSCDAGLRASIISVCATSLGLLVLSGSSTASGRHGRAVCPEGVTS